MAPKLKDVRTGGSDHVGNSPLALIICRFICYFAIIRNIMDKQKLSRLRKRIQALRSRLGNIRSRELISLATALGRKRNNRGKEPTFISELLPHSRPITITEHPRALKKGTAGSILDRLEEDIDLLEEQLPE